MIWTVLSLILGQTFGHQAERNEVVPYPTYKSGVLVGEDGIYTGGYPTNTYPTIVLKEDIVNAEGKGLKAGHYLLILSDDADFLYISQSGQIKAKIPVIEFERAKPPKEKKEKKRKVYYEEKKEEFVHSLGQINQIDLNTYEIIYERQNTRAKGVLKI